MRACMHTCMHVRAPIRGYILDHVSNCYWSVPIPKKTSKYFKIPIYFQDSMVYSVLNTREQGVPSTQGGLEMDSKYFFAKLEKEIKKDWNDYGTTEQDFFFNLFDSQIRLWQAAGYKEDDAVKCFKNEFPEVIEYYMDEYFRVNY